MVVTVVASVIGSGTPRVRVFSRGIGETSTLKRLEPSWTQIIRCHDQTRSDAD